MLFEFKDNSFLLGSVREVDTRKISIYVKNSEDLRKARVGQLVAMRASSGVDSWLIGLIDKVIKSISVSEIAESDDDDDFGLEEDQIEDVINTVRLTLIGSASWNAAKEKYLFTRSLLHIPEIDSLCYVLQGKQLEAFMSILVSSHDCEKSLSIGNYTIDESAVAYLDGNKFFQRHAAILGSTGSGKSWTVATILEKAASLPSSNLIVFDLHGEYKELKYAKYLRIPGPEELSSHSENLIFLPYWLLNTEEMQSLFIDSSEFTAHNQVTKFQDIVIAEKRGILERLGKENILQAFTLDSPIPYEIAKVIEELKRLNEEKVPGAKENTTKQGDFFGQFSRFLIRLNSKISDRRYGFMFQAPDGSNDYKYMAKLMQMLVAHSEKSNIKVIDFSEVPTDILPIITGLVARIIYQIQFWTEREQREPIALVCDEAHLYLPKKDGQNPIERRAVEAFERIAKEGRKYGVALLVISQRPSDVSTTILCQCSNIIALRLTNSDDQATVKKLMPESLESLLDILPIMDVGEALVVGDAILLPSRIKIASPKEKPLSNTIDFWTEWKKCKADINFEKSVENMRRQSRT